MALFDTVRKVWNGHPLSGNIRTNPENPSTPLSNPAAWLLDWAGGRTRSGRSVTIESALSLSPLNCGVRLITETMASLQLIIEAPKNHYLHDLFENPSPFYTRFSLIESMQYDALTSGNGFARLIRNSKSDPRIKEIRHLPASQVLEAIPNYKEGVIFYKIKDHLGRTEQITQTDLLHIPFFPANGIWGRSPFSMMKDTIALMLTAQDYMSDLLQKGGKTEGVIMTPMGYSPDAKKNIEGSWNEGKRGVKVLEEGLKFMPVSMKPGDMGYNALYVQLIREASRVLNIPAPFLHEDSESTYSNTEQKGTALQVYTLRPWVKKWEHELNRKLFLPTEQGKNRFRFNMNSLSRGDTQSRAELYNSMQQGFALKVNEQREMEGLDPIPDGDVLVGPLNFTTLDKMIAQPIQQDAGTVTE